MIGKLGSATTSKVVEVLTDPEGLGASLWELSPEVADTFDVARVQELKVSAELAEKTAGAKYPAVNVYCEKIINDQTEKFRAFSGRVQMVVEVRLSQDRLEGLTDTAEIFADAVSDVLSKNRGDWGDGMFYGGAYEVAFTAVKHGGKNFVQSAKVVFEVGVSK